MLIHTLEQILDIYQPEEYIPIDPATDSSLIGTRDSNRTSEQRLAALHKREVEFSSGFWALSHISTPPFYDWYHDKDIREEKISDHGVVEDIIYKYY